MVPREDAAVYPANRSLPSAWRLRMRQGGRLRRRLLRRLRRRLRWRLWRRLRGRHVRGLRPAPRTRRRCPRLGHLLVIVIIAVRIEERERFPLSSDGSGGRSGGRGGSRRLCGRQRGRRRRRHSRQRCSRSRRSGRNRRRRRSLRFDVQLLRRWLLGRDGSRLTRGRRSRHARTRRTLLCPDLLERAHVYIA